MSTDKNDALAGAQPEKAQRPLYRKKRHWFLAIVVVVIIFAVINHKSTTPGNSGNSGTTATTVTTTTAANTPGIGQVAQDGDFAFVVGNVECGAKADAVVEGSDGFGETIPAGAQECIFPMNVTDDKGTAQTFFASNQYAYDAAGQQFSADTDATIYITNSNDDTQVNPGITITAFVPFQIPVGDKITKLVLHDSAFSGGVTVNVG